MLSHCERITDIGIRHLVSGATVSETLQVLELDNCPLITDQSLDLLRWEARELVSFARNVRVSARGYSNKTISMIPC